MLRERDSMRYFQLSGSTASAILLVIVKKVLTEIKVMRDMVGKIYICCSLYQCNFLNTCTHLKPWTLINTVDTIKFTICLTDSTTQASLRARDIIHG